MDNEQEQQQAPAKPKFWGYRTHDFETELRCDIAMRLLDRTGLPQGADPGDLVQRAFQVADLFLDAAVARGEIREQKAAEAEPEVKKRGRHKKV